MTAISAIAVWKKSLTAAGSAKDLRATKVSLTPPTRRGVDCAEVSSNT